MAKPKTSLVTNQNQNVENIKNARNIKNNDFLMYHNFCRIHKNLSQ